MENIQELLEREDCIDIRDDHENTLLHTILNEPEIETDVIKQILDWGLDINSRNKFGYSPLQYAVSNPDCGLHVIKMLLDRGANINLQDNYGNSALHHILRKSDYGVIKFLIDRGADVNIVNNDGDSPLNHAVNNSKWGVFNLLPNLEESNSQRTKVAKLDVLKLLLDRKPDVNLKNNFGDSPLHYAVNNCNRKEDLIKLLLRRGGDVNLLNNCGDSSLHRAINSCDINPDVIKLLLDYGANVNVKNNYGDYPLYLAVKNPGCLRETLKLLLDKGADVLQCNKSGEFPLRKAIQDCQQDDSALDRVKLLIKYTLAASLGFNVQKLIKNTRHYTPLAKFATECTLEILRTGKEKVGVTCYMELPSPCAVTLYEYMRGYQEVPLLSALRKRDKKKRTKVKGLPKSNINHILRVLNENKFPLFNEVIASKVKRSDMIEKLKRLIVYTVKEDKSSRCKEGGEMVVLDFYSVCFIAGYLLNDDLLNFIMAFHYAYTPGFQASDFPRQKLLSGKRPAEEPKKFCIKRYKLEDTPDGPMFVAWKCLYSK